jgi:cell division protein FtsQ
MTRERIEFTGRDESPTSAIGRQDISARTIDLENNLADGLENEEARFLRPGKRVPVRRGPLARKTATRLRTALAVTVAAALIASLAAGAYGYSVHGGRFRIASSDDIDISGVHNASRVQVMEIAGADIGRNVFFVPLDERRVQLERIPWVESATVMRLFPNRVAVDIAERTPVAFVQIGSKINLIDAAGVVLGPPANRQTRFSFPVIHGMAETDPLSSRSALMKIYNRLTRELDAGGYTRQLSEVDLSDPEDVKATVNDAGGTVMIHLGSSDFLERYNLYAAHIGEWRQQFHKVQSVDLRFEGQIVVNPDGEKSADRVIGPSAKPPEVKPSAKPPTSKPRRRWRRRK